MKHERRVQKRVYLDVLVNKIQDGIPSVCVARDISLHGMRLSRLLEPNNFHTDEVLIEFQLPYREEVLFVAGKLVHESPSIRAKDVGILFTTITPSDSELLRDYIEDDVAA